MRTIARLVAAVWLAATLGWPTPTLADHLMCGVRAERRPQTVSIDPELSRAGITRADVLDSFRAWNELFLRYHGFPIFVEHFGDWWDADILITAHGWPKTWAVTFCDPAYVQRGSNRSVIFLGSEDAWRNRTELRHELGHALGLGDHGTAAQRLPGHTGLASCLTAPVPRPGSSIPTFPELSSTGRW